MKNQTDINRYCLVVGSTDVGRKRAANEDSMGSFETCNGLVSVVCDGMGGHVGGATASRLAVDTIHRFLDEQYYKDPREAIGLAIEAANHAILAETNIHTELRGMGSTCVMLLIRDNKVYIGHVGDSRIYLIRTNTITQLTKDHSYVQMLVDCGQLEPEQAERHPRKNEITNALGIPDMAPATVKEEFIIPESGDCFLLCTDGLSGMVSDKEILSIVSKQKEMGTQERADVLVRRANEHGGVDNITVQLVEFASVPMEARKRTFINKNKKICWAIGILALLLIGGSLVWFLKKDNPIQLNESGDSPQPTETKTSPADKTQKEQILGNVSWNPQFEFVTIVYESNCAKITLLQKKTKRATVEKIGQVTVPGNFDIASLKVKGNGVDYGARGNNCSWIKFQRQEPLQSEIQFSLTSKDSIVYPFKIYLIEGGNESQNKGTEKNISSETSRKDGSELIESVVETAKETIEPTVYDIVLLSNDTIAPFLLLSADKYQVEGGHAGSINLEMKLPLEKNSESIITPSYVKKEWRDNQILFSFIERRETKESFKIAIRTVKEENPEIPVNLVFNCKQK